MIKRNKMSTNQTNFSRYMLDSYYEIVDKYNKLRKNYQDTIKEAEVAYIKEDFDLTRSKLLYANEILKAVNNQKEIIKELKNRVKNYAYYEEKELEELK